MDDGGGHVVDRRHAIHSFEQPLALVVGNQRLGQFAVDLEALAGDLCIVVGAGAACLVGALGDP